MSSFSSSGKWSTWISLRDFVDHRADSFDSLQDGTVAVLTPHTGFSDPATPADAPLRESIELRALVFYE